MSYSIERGARFIRVRYWGTLTTSDVQRIVRDATSAENRPSSAFMNRIEDLRNIDSITIGFKEVSSLSQRLSNLHLPRIVKTALLTRGPLQYGMARMFQAILDHPTIRVSVFTSEDEALKWLALPESEDDESSLVAVKIAGS